MKNSRGVLIVIGAVVALCLTSGFAVVLLGGALLSTVESPTKFAPSVFTPREFREIFGIPLTGLAEVHSRELGFQDPEMEAFGRLPDEAAFLKANAFTVGDSVTTGVNAEGALAALKALRPHAGSIAVFALEGVQSSEVADGGFDPEWNRSGLLLRADGESWVYVLSFGT